VLDLNIDEVAKTLAVKLKEWPGNCYAIASMMVKADMIPGGKARYGHWLGPVAPHTMFDGVPLVRHGWVEYQNDDDVTIIVDPTRWVFEGSDPYIYQCPDFEGYYDRGGNSFRLGLMMDREVPENDGKGDQYLLPPGSVGKAISEILEGYEGANINMDQLGYVANQSLQVLGDHGKAIFKWIQKYKQKAMIPIDNWEFVMEG
jgi:hypothetical protein